MALDYYRDPTYAALRAEMETPLESRRTDRGIGHLHYACVANVRI